MERKEGKILFLKKKRIFRLYFWYEVYIFKKSPILSITPEILDFFLVKNIAGSWVIFLLYSFLLGGKL